MDPARKYYRAKAGPKEETQKIFGRSPSHLADAETFGDSGASVPNIWIYYIAFIFLSVWTSCTRSLDLLQI